MEISDAVARSSGINLCPKNLVMFLPPAKKDFREAWLLDQCGRFMPKYCLDTVCICCENVVISKFHTFLWNDGFVSFTFTETANVSALEMDTACETRFFLKAKMFYFFTSIHLLCMKKGISISLLLFHVLKWNYIFYGISLVLFSKFDIWHRYKLFPFGSTQKYYG